MKNSKNKVMALALGAICIGAVGFHNSMNAAESPDTDLTKISTDSPLTMTTSSDVTTPPAVKPDVNTKYEYTDDSGKKITIEVDYVDGNPELAKVLRYSEKQATGLLKLKDSTGKTVYTYSNDGTTLVTGKVTIGDKIYDFDANTGISTEPIENNTDIKTDFILTNGSYITITKHTDNNGAVTFTLSTKQPIGLIKLTDTKTNKVCYAYTEDGVNLFVGSKTIDGKIYTFSTATGIADGYQDQTSDNTIKLEGGNEIVRNIPSNPSGISDVKAYFKTAVPKGWYKARVVGTDKDVWYYTEDGINLKVGEVYVDGKFYFLNPINCQLDGNCWVNDGFLADGIVIGVSTFYNANGIRVSGWLNFDDRWLYADLNGDLVSGWKKIDNRWYYLDTSSGEMRTGWVLTGGTWYYLDPNGSMATGWRKVNDVWYFLTSNGAMKTGWLQNNGVWYYLNDNGSMAKGWVNDRGTWYFLTSNGAMKTGWVNISGKWYFMKANGAMMTKDFISNGVRYYVASDGSCTW